MGNYRRLMYKFVVVRHEAPPRVLGRVRENGEHVAAIAEGPNFKPRPDGIVAHVHSLRTVTIVHRHHLVNADTPGRGPETRASVCKKC